MIDPDKNSPIFNSYASVDDLKKYAEDRNITLADSGLEALLITAMDYLESQKWLGKRTNLNQPLSFPRSGLSRDGVATVSYTHLTLPTTCNLCRSRWSPYH